MIRLRSFLSNPFAFLFSRTSNEERMAAYVIREHGRGRALAEILQDPYVRNRCTEAEIARLLDRPEVIRHHRLIELYLAKTLGLHVDDVHAEADRLEHVLSEELEAKIDSALGYPTHDPHGDPIPNADLQWPK